MKNLWIIILLTLGVATVPVEAKELCTCQYSLAHKDNLITVEGPGSYKVENTIGIQGCRQYGKDIIQNFTLYYSTGETLENLKGIQDLMCV